MSNYERALDDAIEAERPTCSTCGQKRGSEARAEAAEDKYWKIKDDIQACSLKAQEYLYAKIAAEERAETAETELADLRAHLSQPEAIRYETLRAAMDIAIEVQAERDALAERVRLLEQDREALRKQIGVQEERVRTLEERVPVIGWTKAEERAVEAKERKGDE